MRTKLMASVALAVLGMGTAAFGSATPYEAVKEGTQVMTAGGTTPSGVPNTDILAGTNDDARGSQLAGLVHAYEIGAQGANGTTFINNYTNDIIAAVATTDVNGGRYTGEEAYGVARAGQYGLGTGATAAVVNYYAQVNAGTYVGTYGGAVGTYDDAHAAYVVSPTSSLTNPDSIGFFGLSHHVLASDLVGASTAGTYQGALITALGNWDVTAADAQTRATNLEVSTTQALATALWALKTTGVTDAQTIGTAGDLDELAGGNTIGDLKDLLVERLTSNSYAVYQHLSDNLSVTGDLSAVGYSEDIAYGILALKAFNDPTLAGDIAALEAKLAAAMSASTGMPYNVATASGYSAQYTGAALQALPEPASLSLLALGGLGLLARRRQRA